MLVGIGLSNEGFDLYDLLFFYGLSKFGQNHSFVTFCRILSWVFDIETIADNHIFPRISKLRFKGNVPCTLSNHDFVQISQYICQVCPKKGVKASPIHFLATKHQISKHWIDWNLFQKEKAIQVKTCVTLIIPKNL